MSYLNKDQSFKWVLWSCDLKGAEPVDANINKIPVQLKMTLMENSECWGDLLIQPTAWDYLFNMLLLCLLVGLCHTATPVHKPVYSNVTEGERWNIIKKDYIRINTWMRLAPRAEGPVDNRLYLFHQIIHI